ncbi:MAG TPA: urea amidolyase associated protein UAAP2 [Polyangiales bacterium]|nr:urea amidolyase associated protein UAAP2 [Polyangiales bacterium]
MSKLQESTLDPAKAVVNQVVPAGEPWLGKIARGQFFRIVDLEGNQAVDTLFFNANDTRERYSASDTIRMQGNLYLTAGTVLRANTGAAMLKIVADTCGRHDTLGGACSSESNTVRYGQHTKAMHSCRDSFLYACATSGIALGGLGPGAAPALDKRDLTNNINFFMNVPVTPAGKLTFADGISAGGKYVELRAEMDVLCLISNCPQLNNPCNGYNPTPIRVLIWNA